MKRPLSPPSYRCGHWSHSSGTEMSSVHSSKARWGWKPGRSSTTLKSSPVASSTNTGGAGAGALLASLDTVVFWTSEPALAGPEGAGPVLVVVSLAFSAMLSSRAWGRSIYTPHVISLHAEMCSCEGRLTHER